jgi:DNA-binding Lrp family transcriptional regulator
LDEEVWICIESFCVPPRTIKKRQTSESNLSTHKGETKMPTAYILVNTEIGSEKHVLKALKKIDGVEKVNNLLGVYDIIVNIKANSMDELNNIIINRIEKIGKINSKLTMLINEKNPNTIHEQVIFEKPLVQ